MNPDQVIPLAAVGDLYIQKAVLTVQVQELTAKLAAKDAEIAALKAPQADATT